MVLRQIRNVPRAEFNAAALSVGVSVALLAIKFVAYYVTGSAAIFSDALESIVNVLASLFAAYSLFLAHQPADEKHPYGHGKVEFLSAGFEGGMILLAAVIITARAIQAMIQGPKVEKLDLGLLLMAVAGIVNGGVGLYLIRAGRARSSVTLVADGKHLLSDAVTSAGVVVALLLVKLTDMRWIDPIAALCVAVYIAALAIHLLRESAAGLMDQQDVRDEAMLRGILDSHLAPDGKQPHICSYHKLRHRHSGRYHWVDFHIMVPASWDVKHGHEVASSIEYEIEQAIGEGNATAHVEPCVDEVCAVCGTSQPTSAAG
jgi:cation diffusion facilitator family transporter